MKFINSSLNELKLFHIKVACKLLEARVKQHLLYLRPHLYTINI